jgi:DNA polymerase-4
MMRKILHLDLDAFFCSVEENNDPSLRGKPFVVGGQPGERGVVASCSYAARMYGVHSAMATGRAVRLCPDLIIISHRHADYGIISKKVMEYLKTLTPLIEQISIDEAFLDLSDLPDSGDKLAISIQQYIWENFNLPCSIGVATNKLVAKIATNVGKASKRSNLPPRAIKVVSQGTEAEFLAPLPTQALWGIGPKTSARLACLGIHTIGDIVRWPKEERTKHLGKYGDELYKHAQGIDESEIHTSHGVKSVSNETTFARDVDDLQTLYETLHKLSESVGRRLRKKNLSGNTIKLKLRWHNFTTLSRQATLTNSTNDDYEIYSAAKKLFNTAWQSGKRVRLLGVGVTNFENNPHQLSLWDKPDKKDSNLLVAVDSIRDRYGKNTIIRGSDLKYTKSSRTNEE